jgi:hypothetical protein
MLMLLKKFLGAIAVGVFTLGAATAYAGAAADATCKDAKAKGTGKYVLGTAKAFGKNIKVTNTAKLSQDLSKAHSKMTKAFTKAEFAGSGASKNCDTIEDVDDIEAKGDALVADVLDELEGAPFCASTLTFTTGLPGGSCGRINNDSAGTGTDLTPYGAGSAQLDCGTLYIGGGAAAQPPSPSPDGASNVLNVDDCSVPSSLPLSATTSVETGSNETCTSPGCKFGPPLPIPNAGSPAASTCVYNEIAASPPVSGTLNSVSGASTQTIPLTVIVKLHGDLEPAPGIQPCPRCTGGTCDSGSNSGGACSTTTSLMTSHDCPTTVLTLAPFNVDLTPLTTGTATLSSGTGVFCPGPPVQRTAGCFGNPTCEYVEANGSPGAGGNTGAPVAATLASSFCIAKSSAFLINTVADLPGPGAVTLKGTANLD